MAQEKKKPPKAADGYDLVVENRKARHDFFIEESVEAGLALTGTEVKSLRAHQRRRGVFARRPHRRLCARGPVQPQGNAQPQAPDASARDRSLLGSRPRKRLLAGAIAHLLSE